MPSGNRINKSAFKLSLNLIFSLLFPALILLTSCNTETGIQLNRAEREYLANKNVIVFAAETNYPPFEFVLKNGSSAGMSIELLRWIATETGFNIEFVPMEHGKIQRSLNEGKVDAIAGLFASPERNKNFLLTSPYFIIPGIIFIKTERPDINSAADLQNKKIAVMVDDYAEEWLALNNIDCELIRTADFYDAVQMVISGKADALIGDEQPVLHFLYSKNERALLKRIEPPLYRGLDCVAVSLNNPHLASIIDKGIKFAEHTGILKKINDKWLGIPVDTREPIFKKYMYTFAAVLSILLIIILTAFFWIFLLRREVARRTSDLKLEINKLRKTENELNDTVMRYQGIYENTPDSIFWLKKENDSFFIENVNPAHEKNTGLGNDVVAGKYIDQILPTELAGPVIKNYNNCIDSGSAISYEEEVFLGGENRVFRTLLVPIFNKNKEYTRIVGFSRDVTAARDIELAIRHTQKLESLGILAGGIAHDFNNLLSAIMGNIDLTIQTYTSSGFRQKYLDNAILASRRAADLCSQLLAYSGKGISEFQKVKLNEIINEMMNILEVSISKKIKFTVKSADEIPWIDADPSQVRQIIMNLVINASEALNDSEGDVVLSTGSGFFTKKDLTTLWINEDVNDGLYSWIKVDDTGCGMSDETLSHLFDPFFTTKFTGRGLGLAAVLGIVRGHGGSINVKSSPGKGSSFTVYFPAINGNEKMIQNVYIPDEDLIHEGYAMVVDDEEGVRTVAASMLELSGFTVLTSFDGLDAVSKIKDFTENKNGSLKVILLDLTMPHMDGAETFKKISKICPESRIILMSGYSENDITEKFADTGISGFLQKPFQLQDLRKKLSEILK
jgi:PAS domain S-box-containing protein